MRSAVGGFERVGAHVLVAVVGRRRAAGDEVPRGGPPSPRRTPGSRPCPCRTPRPAAPSAPASRRSHLEVAIGPEGRDHAAGPRRVGGERRVRGEVVARVVGGGQDRDPEPLEQGARPEGGLGEPRRQLVVDRVRRRGGRTALDAEDLHQLVLEPVADRRAAEDVPVGAHPPPDVPRLRLGRGPCADPERVERDARGVQQAGHVVIGRHQQRRRVGERLVRRAACAGPRVRGVRSPGGRARRRTAHARSRGPRARRAAGGPGGVQRTGRHARRVEQSPRRCASRGGGMTRP